MDRFRDRVIVSFSATRSIVEGAPVNRKRLAKNSLGPKFCKLCADLSLPRKINSSQVPDFVAQIFCRPEFPFPKADLFCVSGLPKAVKRLRIAALTLSLATFLSNSRGITCQPSNSKQRILALPSFGNDRLTSASN